MNRIKWEVIVGIAALFILATIAMVVQPWNTPEAQLGVAEKRVVATMSAQAEEAVSAAGEVVKAADEVVSKADNTAQTLETLNNELLEENTSLSATIESQQAANIALQAEKANLEGQLEIARTALENLGVTPEAPTAEEAEATEEPDEDEETADEPTDELADTAEEGRLLAVAILDGDEDVIQEFENWFERTFPSLVLLTFSECEQLKNTDPVAVVFADNNISLGKIDGQTCVAELSNLEAWSQTVFIGHDNNSSGERGDWTTAGASEVVRKNRFSEIEPIIVDVLGLE